MDIKNVEDGEFHKRPGCGSGRYTKLSPLYDRIRALAVGQTIQATDLNYQQRHNVYVNIRNISKNLNRAFTTRVDGESLIVHRKT
jgi:hypothetical protein